MNFNLVIILNMIIYILVTPLPGHCTNNSPTENNHRLAQPANNSVGKTQPGCSAETTVTKDDEQDVDKIEIDKLNFQRAWPLDEKCSIENSWSKTRHSEGIRILPNNSTLHRKPALQVTDICTANQSYDSKIHIWRIKWPRSNNTRYSLEDRRGTHASIGIVTPEAETLSAEGYKNLLGSTDLSSHSFAWDIINNKILHNGEKIKNYPDNKKKYIPSEDIAVILNMDHGRLGFYDIEKDVYLGDAVTGLEGKWAPAINCVWGNALINLIYCGQFEKTPSSLQQLCKDSIKKNQKKRSNSKNLDLTKLPAFIQRYLFAKEPSVLDDTDKKINSF